MAALASTTYRPNIRQDGAFVFHHPPKNCWPNDPIDRQKWHDFSLYFHVPFCRKICNFCTFERRLVQKGALSWFSAMVDREMDMALAADDFTGSRLESVYFGGGTASLLSNAAIAGLIRRLEAGFGWNPTIETTLECEPGTKHARDFRELRHSGVNRVSVGVQSFSNEALARLNRAHTVEQSLKMVEDARAGGIENLHIDLMYGLPGQTFEEWVDSVDRTIGLDVEHVSLYPLIVFENQLLSRMIVTDLMPRQPLYDAVERMRVYAAEAFLAAGFERYSLIEFARPGRRCRYVTATWDGSDYLGFGPGSYSRCGPAVWEDTVLHGRYESMINESKRPVGKSIRMSPPEVVQRDIAMGLCMLSVDIQAIERRAGVSVREVCGDVIDELREQDLVRVEAGRLALTEDGVRYATHVMKCFTTCS